MLFVLHQSRGTSCVASSAVRPSPPGLVWQPACFTAPPQNARFLFGGGKIKNKQTNRKPTREQPEDCGGKGAEGLFCAFFHPCLYES